eukprot:PITA_15832
MSPFEVLYGRKCRVPIDWNNPVNKFTLGLDMLAKMEETMRKIQQNLRATLDRQKMYADKKRTYMEFQPRDHIYLRAKPWKSSLQWQGCAKLAPRYCGPFQVLERVGLVAYKLALPSHIQVEPEGEFLPKPLRILDQRETNLRKRSITQVKVQWKHFGPEEATWEEEEFMRKVYPTLFFEGRENTKDDVPHMGGEM